jgi:hypothetical protein
VFPHWFYLVLVVFGKIDFFRSDPKTSAPALQVCRLPKTSAPALQVLTEKYKIECNTSLLSPDEWSMGQQTLFRIPRDLNNTCAPWGRVWDNWPQSQHFEILKVDLKPCRLRTLVRVHLNINNLTQFKFNHHVRGFVSSHLMRLLSVK